MNGFFGKLLKLREIAANKFTLRIKFFRLGNGIENPKVGLRIVSRGGGALLASIFPGELKVIEVLGKVRFAPAPINTKIFG